MYGGGVYGWMGECSIRGSNPGAAVHKTGALPTAPVVQGVCVCNNINYKFAQCGDRTHELRMMRRTRCPPRQSCRVIYFVS